MDGLFDLGVPIRNRGPHRVLPVSWREHCRSDLWEGPLEDPDQTFFAAQDRLVEEIKQADEAGKDQ